MGLGATAASADVLDPALGAGPTDAAPDVLSGTGVPTPDELGALTAGLPVLGGLDAPTVDPGTVPQADGVALDGADALGLGDIDRLLSQGDLDNVSGLLGAAGGPQHQVVEPVPQPQPLPAPLPQQDLTGGAPADLLGELQEADADLDALTELTQLLESTPETAQPDVAAPAVEHHVDGLGVDEVTTLPAQPDSGVVDDVTEAAGETLPVADLDSAVADAETLPADGAPETVDATDATQPEGEVGVVDESTEAALAGPTEVVDATAGGLLG